MRGHLGTHKDIEKLARKARKLGWTVEITNNNHVRWTPPGDDAKPVIGGLTMSGGGVLHLKKKLKRAGLEW